MTAILVIVVLALIACVFIAGRQSRNWYSAHDDDGVIDHVFVKAADGHDRWRLEALAKAAVKYGRPFKDGPKDIPHEVIHRQEPRSHALQEIDAASKREREGAKLAKLIEEQTNITQLGRKAR